MAAIFEEFAKHFEEHTDLGYLRVHFARFWVTKNLAYEDWKWDKADVLDIGAHWLHQSLLYALDGHHVTAADFSRQLSQPAILSLASRHGIDLLAYEDLSSDSVFDDLADESIDVVLFCEILEHITFNPVGMWKAIYRVLRPGGRIIITTPNFYRATNILRQFLRFLSGMGGGAPVTEILNNNTYSHHWKEYSIREITEYFDMLSSDFSVVREKYVDFALETLELNWKGTLVNWGSKFLPIFRENIFLSIELSQKSTGIQIEPGWQRIWSKRAR